MMEYTGEHRRAEDESVPWRISTMWNKWNWLITPLGVVIVMLGFKVTGPASEIRRLDARIDTMKSTTAARFDTMAQWHDAGFEDRKDLRLMLSFSVRAQCAKMTDQQKQDLGGVDVCEAALHPLAHAIQARIRGPGESLQ